MIPLHFKREAVREHLELIAKVSRAEAAKSSAYADFVEHRAARVVAMDHEELDLLLADWKAQERLEDARGARRAHYETLERLLSVFSLRTEPVAPESEKP